MSVRFRSKFVAKLATTARNKRKNTLKTNPIEDNKEEEEEKNEEDEEAEEKDEEQARAAESDADDGLKGQQAEPKFSGPPSPGPSKALLRL